MISRRLLRDRANAIARAALAPVPLAFWENAFPKDVLALCYHVVSDDDLPHLQLYPYKDAAQFEADVRFARGRAVTYRAVLEARTARGAREPNGILFTFDDGLVQCYDVIRPILRRHDVDAVFFVTTDYLDDREAFFECTVSLCVSAIARLEPEAARAVLARLDAASGPRPPDPARAARAAGRLAATRVRVGADAASVALVTRAFGIADGDPELDDLCRLLDVDPHVYAARTPIFMSRAQVAELAADGFTIGAHGRKHRSLEPLSRADLEREIVGSCEAVRAITGQARVPFAFPYSGLGVSRATLADLVRRNPIVELVFDSGCLRSDPGFIVNRVFTDAPAARDGTSSVPAALRDAWSVPSAWYRATR